MKVKFLFPFVALLALLAGCAANIQGTPALSTTYPLTITDSTGTEVTIPSEPQRIISLLPSTTETLCALGSDICSLLVGRDAFSNYPEEVSSVAEVGSIFDPNQEKIVAATPDLVFSDNGQTAQAYNKRLNDLGINVIASKAVTYSEVFEDIKRIGRIMNRQEEAQTIVSDMQQEITAVRELVKDEAKPNILFISSFYQGQFSFAGSESFIGELIEQAGGTNIVSGEGGFVNIGLEDIAKLNPDIIIISTGSTVDELANIAPFGDLQAVKDRNVFSLNQAQRDVVVRPTPRMVDSIKILGNIIHPDLVTAPF